MADNQTATPPELAPKPKADDKPKAQEDPRQGLPDTVQLDIPEEGQTVAPVALDTTKRVDPNNQYIQYNGIGTMRIMGPAEWAAAGLKGDAAQQYFEWNYFNKKRIPRSSFTDEQLQYLLRVDDRFELVEVKEAEEKK